jgi:hypothetical protein
MNRLKLFLAASLIIFTLSTTSRGDVPGAHKYILGTVDKISGDMVFVEMEDGATRTLTLHQTKREGIEQLKSGSRVLLEVDEGNQIIDVIDIGEKHQLVRGKVTEINQAKKSVTLKLKNGMTQSYKMKDALVGKMALIKPGTPVTLMIDAHNNWAMDVAAD